MRRHRHMACRMSAECVSFDNARLSAATRDPTRMPRSSFRRIGKLRRKLWLSDPQEFEAVVGVGAVCGRAGRKHRQATGELMRGEPLPREVTPVLRLLAE